MLKRVTAASVFPVTLAEAKLQCRVDYDDDDTLFLHYIAAANEKIGAMCGLVLGEEVWELTVTDPVGEVALCKPPVTSLVSVNGEVATAYTMTVDGDLAVVSGDWPAGKVAIQFTAGGDAPLGAKSAMMFLIAHWYQNREGTSTDVPKEIPYAIESMVSEHRRGWVQA